MSILKNLSFFDLTKYNSFGLAIEAEHFVEVTNVNDLQLALASPLAKENQILILGGGSNILFTKNYKGLVIYNNITGIIIEKEDEDCAYLKAGGGEVWHKLVEFAIRHNLGGIENLSLIPGTVGAAPIQNIGAYGVELKEVLVSLEAIEIKTGIIRNFNNKECEFGYRNSIFKNEFKDKYVITSVLLKLTKNAEVNTSYGAINTVLQEKGIDNPGIKDVSEAVVEIRQSKLPDPREIGNAGSFFKNPVVDLIDYEGLQLTFPEIPGYKLGAFVKIPAAWLIDQSGWKGFRRGNVGVHKNQPLVLVNYGGGTGTELLELAMEIKDDIASKFGVVLEPEPRII
jgi:UDP-N-acetylmuramate dehydrogenase